MINLILQHFRLMEVAKASMNVFALLLIDFIAPLEVRWFDHHFHGLLRLYSINPLLHELEELSIAAKLLLSA